VGWPEPSPAAPPLTPLTPMSEEPLTEAELTVAYDLWIARLNHKAGAVLPEFLPAAHRLWERGWVSRRFHNDDLVWEFTDEGAVALGLSALLSETSPN
jgi:hypothetical protein